MTPQFASLPRLPGPAQAACSRTDRMASGSAPITSAAAIGASAPQLPALPASRSLPGPG